MTHGGGVKPVKNKWKIGGSVLLFYVYTGAVKIILNSE